MSALVVRVEVHKPLTKAEAERQWRSAIKVAEVAERIYNAVIEQEEGLR
jgi:hypothetical protein